ncbi:MAG: hypothetical protein LH478_06460 [Chitinophagaceae bacterium]|nr:hypothetical protein [Chitinophagaceae bacterium]
MKLKGAILTTDEVIAYANGPKKPARNEVGKKRFINMVRSGGLWKAVVGIIKHHFFLEFFSRKILNARKDLSIQTMR